MKQIVLGIITLIISCINTSVFAQYERPGSSSAQFLKIDVHPRAASLSGAVVSMVNGADATYYNSGALAVLEGTNAAFNHTSWFAGIQHSFVSITHNVSPKIGSFGASITALYTDEMLVRTPLQPEGTGETFVSGNYKFGLSYGKRMSDYVTFGGTVNYVHMMLYNDFKAEAFAFDLGVLYKSNVRDFSFGMQISNFGSDINFYSEAYPLPTYFTFGTHVNIIERETVVIRLTGAAYKPNEGSPMAAVGTELILINNLAIRAGSKINHSVQSWSAGLGYTVPLSDKRLVFDYSISEFNVLGSVHRVGLSIGL